MKQHRILVGLIFAVLGISIVGCGDNKTHLSGLVPAKGNVTYNGSPLEGASVIFIPDDAATPQQRSAAGLTDSNGKFIVMTLQPDDGIFPGNYKVTVTKKMPDREITQEEHESRKSTGMVAPKFIDTLPAKYAKVESTPLSITFEKKGNTAIVFELTD